MDVMWESEVTEGGRDGQGDSRRRMTSEEKMMILMEMLLMMGVCTDSVKVAAKTSPTFLISWMRGGGG